MERADSRQETRKAITRKQPQQYVDFVDHRLTSERGPVRPQKTEKRATRQRPQRYDDFYGGPAGRENVDASYRKMTLWRQGLRKAATRKRPQRYNDFVKLNW